MSVDAIADSGLPAPSAERREAPASDAPASWAGPLQGAPALRLPPAVELPRSLARLRLSVRQTEVLFRARRELGDVFRIPGVRDEHLVVTSHPDHVRSLFRADPGLVPSSTVDSPVRPIVGPSSVLTTIGAVHMRQRRLVLPALRGEAVARYAEMIQEIAEREIERWPIGVPFALAPRMAAVTLDVIMAAVFGVSPRPAPGTLEDRARRLVRNAVGMTTQPWSQAGEIISAGSDRPPLALRPFLAYVDRLLRQMIDKRRRESSIEHTDVLSLLLHARDEDGVPLRDDEIRDQLVTLVLAGHETTANALAWGFERLLRNPAAYDRLREEVRAGEGEEYIEATIHETMRTRPVVPVIGRRVAAPWQFGDYTVPAGTPVLVGITLLHHRADVYPDPFAYRPERFLGVKPGAYTWIPFGGGIRRCAGATLAMAEQRAVLRVLAERTDLQAPDPTPEHIRHRNVTAIPAKHTQVILTHRS